jgi:sigma-B regulation protein RsbU (phosphoserine phosphatase)
MTAPLDVMFREQLLERRRRLEAAATGATDTAEIGRLIDAVDAALSRIELGRYGICEICDDPLETEALVADPVLEVCLSHLTADQQTALENDLELAARIQNGLLPPNPLVSEDWLAAYHYEPTTLVSGDYCDAVPGKDGTLYFMLGDVAGHGVSAALLMSHLHALFHALIPLDLPLGELAERASRAFCESTLPTHYATLVCGRANRSGRVDLVNAGHVPPLVGGRGTLRRIEATGFPLGMFGNARFEVETVEVAPGSTILFYTDGLSEARNRAGEEYGEGRVSELFLRHASLAPADIIHAYREDLMLFRGGAARGDDLTFLVVRRL